MNENRKFRNGASEVMEEILIEIAQASRWHCSGGAYKYHAVILESFDIDSVESFLFLWPAVFYQF